ncbi:MAG: hypothetical protein JSV89_20965 [Spirochaetaceae bacterium]|nr:MAG: hypothetical protein JSV89_20965 [Spirochaetaceae bacterium]
MEKISSEAKKRYAERVKEYRERIDEITDRNKEREIRIQKTSKSQGLTSGQYRGDQSTDPETLKEVNSIRFELADQYLNIVSYYNLMNALSISLLGIKNESFLNDARKSCYKSIIYMEEIVSPYIDAPFSDYQHGVESVGDSDDRSKYRFLTKLGFAIDSVIEGFGSGSKWKWSFVELQGRYAVIAKNLLNLKTFIARLDPRIEGYSERLAHVQLAKRLLQQSADRYREKYELSTMRLDDIKKAILFLAAMKRLHTLLGEMEESDVVKKKMEIWKTKMEDDQKKREMAQKMEKLKKPGS